MVDQLNIEKKGIPTVTVTTTPFVDMIKSTLKEQGVADLSLVVTEHPIAGHNLEGIKKKVDKDFPEIMKAATQWQPVKK